MNISHNLISGEIDVLFAPSIKDLDASFNKFKKVKPFEGFKPSHLSLRKVDLSHNLINQELKILFRNVPVNLEEILLSHNRLVGSFPASLEYLDVLRSVEIASNFLTGTLPDLSASFPKLRVLILSDNSFTGPITGTLTNLQFLNKLDLSRNGLSSFDETAVLPNLIQLAELDLSYNELASTIPKGIGKLSCK